MREQFIEGRIVWRGDSGYEDSRRSGFWNRRVPSYLPRLIAYASSEADVRNAVRFALRNGFKIAVRSGGHSWIASSLRDECLLLDLSALRRVTIDSASRTAVVQPAVRSKELAAMLRTEDLAFPVGHCSTIGIGGFLLGGGLGFNPATWGPACLSVKAVEVVTAGGEVITANERDNADYFWMARGSGPAFPGVVTRFHLQLHKLPERIVTHNYEYELTNIDGVMAGLMQVQEGLSRSIECTVTVRTGPNVAAIDETNRGVVVVSATAFADDNVAAEAMLRPLRNSLPQEGMLGRKAEEATTIDDWFDSMDALFPADHRYAADTIWSAADLTAISGSLQRCLARAPSAKSLLIADMERLRISDDVSHMAFSMADRTFVACYAIWTDESDDAANLGWLRESMGLLHPIATGHYLAEADLSVDISHAARSFGPSHWERLHRLRSRLDPMNVFHSFPVPIG